MSLKIRLHGTEKVCREAVERLASVFDLLSVSDPYLDRGRSVLVRVYIEAELSGGQPAASGEDAGDPLPGNRAGSC